MKHKIQLYLDLLDLKEALRSAGKFSDMVDWIGVSRALINSEGSKSIAKMKAMFPEKRIIADMKAVDVSDIEYAAKANADMIVISGAIDRYEMENCIKSAKENDKEIMLDMTSNHIGKKIPDFSTQGIDYVLLNHDQVKNLAGKVNVPFVVNIPHYHDEAVSEVMGNAAVFSLNTSTVNREDIFRIRDTVGKKEIKNHKMEKESMLTDKKLENMKELLLELKEKLMDESERIKEEKTRISEEWQEIRKKEEELENEKIGTTDKFKERQEKLWSAWEKKQRDRWEKQMSELKSERVWIEQEKEKIKDELKRIEDEWTELLEKGKFIEENTMDVVKAREFIEKEKEAVREERENLEHSMTTLEEESDRIAEEKATLEKEWEKLQDKETEIDIIKKSHEKELVKKQEEMWLAWEEKQRVLLEEEMLRTERVIEEEQKRLAEDKKGLLEEITQLKNEKIELKREQVTIETERAKIKKQEEYLKKKETDMQRILEEKQKIKFTEQLQKLEEENKSLKEQRGKLNDERKSIDLMIGSIEEAKYKLNDERDRIEREKEKLEQLNDKVAEELKAIGIENLEDLPAFMAKFTELEREMDRGREELRRERDMIEKERAEIAKEREKLTIELTDKGEKKKLDERRTKLENELSAIERDLMKLKAEHSKTEEIRKSSPLTRTSPRMGTGSQEMIRDIERGTRQVEVKRVVNKKELINELIDLVNREEKIELRTAAKKLKVSPELVRRWSAVLKKRYVIDVEKPIIGDTVLRKGMFMHKFN